MPPTSEQRLRDVVDSVVTTPSAALVAALAGAEAAGSVLRDMATFDSAGVAHKESSDG